MIISKKNCNVYIFHDTCLFTNMARSSTTRIQLPTRQARPFLEEVNKGEKQDNKKQKGSKGTKCLLGGPNPR